ncbi:MAG: putative actin beta/gamma 1, partial [Streblomastix strix]
MIECYSILHVSISIDIGGRNQNEYLERLLTEHGNFFRRASERVVIHDIKEKLCYVTVDYHSEMHTGASSTSIDKTYEMPDGQILTLGNERFRCQEALFSPFLFGVNEYVLSGGSTMFNGISERMNKELAAFAPNRTQIKITAPPERKYSVWIGGSILASLTTFQQMWV